MKSARSGVEMIVFAVDTSKQCFKVSSTLCDQSGILHEVRFIPRRFVFIKPATAPNLESARIVTTISGELVVKTAMISLHWTPFSDKKAARRCISA